MEERLNRDGRTLKQFLSEYDANKYPHPSVAADIVVFTPIAGENRPLALGVLLIKRGDHPYIGEYAFPGGFMNIDEDVMDTAARELMEETGVEDVPLRQIGMYGAVHRDPRTRVMSVAHMALLPLYEGKIAAGDDAAYTEVFEVDVQRGAFTESAADYRIHLYGSDTLCCPARLRRGVMGTSSENLPGDLAIDHGQILFDALRLLHAQPARRIAAYLTRRCPERETEMALAVESALLELPEENI